MSAFVLQLYYKFSKTKFELISVKRYDLAADNYNRAVQFRASDWTREQLDDLGDRWKMNRSQVIVQCITFAWSRFIENQPQTEASNKILKKNKEEGQDSE